MNQTPCVNCGEPSSPKHGLPVNRNCDISPITSTEPWSGAPSCETCNELHKIAGDAGPAVLDVYAKSVPALRDKLSKFRRIRRELGELLNDMEAE